MRLCNLGCVQSRLIWMCMHALRWRAPAGSVAGMIRVALLAACSANVVAFATLPQKTTYACVDIGFPDDPNFKCADEAEACNDTSDLEWYNELRQICAKTCNACGPVTG